MCLTSLPVAGKINVRSPFGMRDGKLHSGLDIRAAVGTPIFASGAGTVIRASDNSTYGNAVVIDHGVVDGQHTYTLYAHLSEFDA